MNSRRINLRTRGIEPSRRVGNLWPEVARSGDLPVSIPGMASLATHGMKEGSAGQRSLLQAHFDQACDRFAELRLIVDRVQQIGAQCLVIGGWARDTMLGLGPHDIDMVIVGAGSAALEAALPVASRRTALGGFSFEYDGIEIDLWSLPDTHLIRHLALPPTLPVLMGVIDFNINTVLFRPAQSGRGPRLFEGGLFESLVSREIDFNCGVLPLPVAQVSRLAYFSAKLGFGLSHRVRCFMRQQCIVRRLLPEVEANLARYCPPEHRRLTLDTLHATISTLS